MNTVYKSARRMGSTSLKKGITDKTQSKQIGKDLLIQVIYK